MIEWAKKIVEEQLRGAGASPQNLSSAVIAVCMALLFVVLMLVAAVVLSSQ
jgi:hypothetical protein